MVVAEMLLWDAPAILILAVMHLVYTPELESSEACKCMHTSNLNFSPFAVPIMQVYQFVEYFSGAAVLTASLRQVWFSNVVSCKFFSLIFIA